MYNEIDLHMMDSKTALEVFKKKYNEAVKKKDFREIIVIHGYGANKFSVDPSILKRLRSFLQINKDRLDYRIGINPGVTYVLPKKRVD